MTQKKSPMLNGHGTTENWPPRAALLAILYAVTPPGFSSDAPIRAVPLGLTVFAVSTSVRPYLAVAGELARWMVGATVVIETAVLLSLNLLAIVVRPECLPSRSDESAVRVTFASQTG